MNEKTTLYLIPQPHQLETTEGTYRLSWKSRITIDAACGEDAYEYARLLAQDIQAETGLEIMIDKRIKGGHPGIRLTQDSTVKERLGAESFRLVINSNGVEIMGGDGSGLLYGVQTLRQIIRQSGLLLPHVAIEDAPELPARGLFHDITRGRVPTVEFLKRLADTCSFYKINQMHLYIEHTFLFDGFSEIWRDDTPLTAGDILEIDEYCSRRGIDLVPSIATFGHLYKVLRTKTYRHLSELEEEEGKAFSFFDRMHHHTLDVTNEESLRLVYRMMDEFIPLFRSKLFNMNGDETFDLGKGKGKQKADEIGTHAMYLDWIKKICIHAKELGKRPMFWGDIIAAHPETIKELPEDIICMNWDYGHNPGETNVRRLWENGATQYLCPGIQGWSQTINFFDKAYLNIRKMSEYAHKYNAEGVLVTDWGDYGHPCHTDFSMIGIAYAAAMSWNSQIPGIEELNRSISLLEYGDRSGRLVDIVTELSRQPVLHWGELVDFEEELRYRITGKGMDGFWKGFLPRLEPRLPLIEERNQAIDSYCDELIGLMPGMPPMQRARLNPFVVMADGQKVLNRLMAVIDRQFLGHDYMPQVDPTEVASDLETWYYEYRKLWHSVSRESELYRIGEVIFWTADYLRDLAGNGGE